MSMHKKEFKQNNTDHFIPSRFTSILRIFLINDGYCNINIFYITHGIYTFHTIKYYDVISII